MYPRPKRQRVDDAGLRFGETHGTIVPPHGTPRVYPRLEKQMTRVRSLAIRLLLVASAALAITGASPGSGQAGASGAPFQEAIFEGFGEDVDDGVAVLEAEADARAEAADAGFMACWVVDVQVLAPPGLPEPEPEFFPIETIFVALVTISCAD
jgi:hypothetical protein